MEVSNLIDSYIKWLHSEISYSRTGDYFEITTPFLDINNDYIQIYVKIENDIIYITDDGYTINTLRSCGVSLSGKRKELFNTILRQFGVVSTKNYELNIQSSVANFPQAKHLLIQCILKISDLFMTRQTSNNTFLTDVTDFFIKKNIMASENIVISGKSGLNHSYDFIFARSRTKPERLCNVINNPDKLHINNSIFSWVDTRGNRKSDSMLILIVNNSVKTMSDELKKATSSYDISTIPWTERNDSKNLELLAS